MSKKTILIGLISITLAGGWLCYYFSDKEVIKRNLGQLAVEISKTEQESALQMALKMGQVKKRLVNPCQVVIPEQDYLTPLEPDLIIRYLMYYRNRYAKIDLTFKDLEIDIPAQGLATVQTSIHILRQEQQGDATQEVEPVELTLGKQEKTWRIKTVTLPAALVK